MGKTILCEKVIGFDNIVEISGADFNSNTDVWAIVAAKVGLPYKGELMTQRESNEGNSRETDRYGFRGHRGRQLCEGPDRGRI